MDVVTLLQFLVIDQGLFSAVALSNRLSKKSTFFTVLLYCMIIKMIYINFGKLNQASLSIIIKLSLEAMPPQKQFTFVILSIIIPQKLFITKNHTSPSLPCLDLT